MAECIITFQSVYHAFRAKKILADNGIEVILIPVPRQLSGSCEGLAASFSNEEVCKRAIAELDAKGIDMLKRGIKI